MSKLLAAVAGDGGEVVMASAACACGGCVVVM
jgi:hypothetical protein